MGKSKKNKEKGVKLYRAVIYTLDCYKYFFTPESLAT